MYEPDVVYGLLRDGEEVAGTLRDLEAHGVYPQEIEVTVPAPGRYVLADEYLHDDAAATRHGALAGSAVGFVAGLLAATAIDVVTDVGLTGWLVVGFGGAGFGALIGAMTGLQLHEHPDDDPLRYAELDDPTAWRMVAVRCLHWRNRAHNILLRHGAAILDSPSPTGRG